MRNKLTLLLIISVFFSSTSLFANEADNFKYNKQQIQDEFSDLNILEKTVIDYNFITLPEMQSKNMMSGQFSAMHLTNNLMMDPALGIPGFWWGCLLGPVGIIAVYILSDEDKEETKKALTGCIVAGGVEAIIMIAYYVWFLTYWQAAL